MRISNLGEVKANLVAYSVCAHRKAGILENKPMHSHNISGCTAFPSEDNLPS